MENPFILAATPSTDDLEMLREALRAGWAGAVLKTTSIEGNVVSLKYPMMMGSSFQNQNLSGLGNIDLISCYNIDIIEKRVRVLKEEFPNKVIIASIMGETKEHWQTLVRRLEKAGADMIECSFSCPQGTLGSKPGFMLGQDPVLVKKVTRWIKEASKKIPIIIKITPQVTDIVEIAKAVKLGGADGICASNSIPSLMGINLSTLIPNPNVNGKSTYSGYTGAAIKPITLRNIAEIKRHVQLPLTGTGGPLTFRDAIEMMLVGATNVQFGTTVMQYGFGIIYDLLSGVMIYLEEKKIKCVRDIIGKSLPFIGTFDDLPYETPLLSSISKTKCILCGACYTACHDGGHRAIEFSRKDETISIDEKKCVGCAFCLSVCPIRNCMDMISREIK